MKHLPAIGVCILLCLWTAPMHAAASGPVLPEQAGPPAPDAVDTILGEISPERLRTIVDTLAGFGTRHTLSETESDDRGIGASRRWIHQQFERYAAESGREGEQAMRVWFDRHTYGPDRRRIPHEVEIVNVMAEIPGASPAARDRRYYVIAHYDSRASGVLDAEADAPGANDNASGTALVMELARVFSKHRFDATIVFMATAGEEQGLLGARLHAQRAREDGLDIRAVLNSDIVGDPSAPDGSIHADRVRVFSEGLPRDLSAQDLARMRALSSESDSPSRQLARHIAFVASLHETAVQPWLIHRPDRFLRGGDHSAFNDAGFPAVRFCEVEEDYSRQHQDVRVVDGRQYGDLPEFVDEHYLADVTRLNAAVLTHLANAPSEPPNARLLTRLTNDTTLRWDHSPEPNVAGYEVLWRETSAGHWQHVRDVGDVTEVTLPLNKDNFFFAIRAYDERGYRSPAAFPVAARR